MHPIERIRWLARASHLDPQTIAVESADALADACAWLGEAAAVSVARRLLAWRPFCGPLWYAVNRTLGAVDPKAEAAAVATDLRDDPTSVMLSAALPQDAQPFFVGPDPDMHAIRDTARLETLTQADIVLVNASALGPGGAIAAHPACEDVRAAYATDVPVWCVAGRGTVVAGVLWEKMTSLIESGRSRPDTHAISRAWWDLEELAEQPDPDVVPLDTFTFVCGPDGLLAPAEAIASSPPLPTGFLDAAGADAF